MRAEEIIEVKQLKQDIMKEENDKINKKKKEREICQKVIKENEVEKQKRLEDQEKERLRQVQLME